ncbi:LPS export ABC transporter permease LptG [Algiphilus sp.]|uniref:LPS export ABC transporter permease LptG n=1 Tax=Algiphilus sp. TaxID=1872431 RepID=UPI003BAC7584
MKLIDRHIAVHVLGFSAIVGFALLALQSFITLAAEADDISERFSFLDLATVVAFETPSIMLVLMPMIALIGTLLGLGALAQQGELVAMRAAGISVLRIGAATLAGGLLLAALTLLLTDVVAPAGKRASEQLQSAEKYGTDPGVVTRPVWLRGEQEIYHVRRVESPRSVGPVTVYSLGADGGIGVISEVTRAQFSEGAWQAENITQTHFRDDGVERKQVAHMRWPSGPAPDVLELVVLESDALSVRGLLRLIDYLERNDLDAQQYRITLWQKLVSPLTVLVMMLLAVPYVLGSLRDSGTGQRLLVGVLIGVAFWVGNEVIASSALIYRWPPMLSALSPSLIVLVIALWRLRRARE